LGAARWAQGAQRAALGAGRSAVGVYKMCNKIVEAVAHNIVYLCNGCEFDRDFNSIGSAMVDSGGGGGGGVFAARSNTSEAF
jgi:hypothetical protein